MDLATWLLACIAEDEEVARVASDGRWYMERMEPSVLTDDTRANVLTAGSSAPSFFVIYDEAFGGCSVVDAEHIARHDPARVLAECAAKRVIVEHLAATASKCPADDWPDELGMEWASLADQARYVLRLLALPYADREGYDPAWAPSDS